MRELTIIITAYNEKQYIDLSVQSIRMFADVENLSVVVVDNHSADGLQDWAVEQEDITYVYMDERKEPYGILLNQVIRELDIRGDILVVGGHYMFTPFVLSRMLDVLQSDERIGVVGPMSNGFLNYQRVTDISNYEAAVERAYSISEAKEKMVIGLASGAVLFRRETLDKVGGFNEALCGISSVIRDFGLRILLEDYLLVVCENAIVWDSGSLQDENIHNNYDIQVLKENWGMHYFNTMYNENLIRQINEEADAEFSVLEIGCDCGATLLEIKNRYPNACVFGSELNENAVRIASHVANVVVNNIEEQNLECGKGIFDYIIFGDVLEHLRNPLEAIKYCKTLLKKEGCIIASIPNVMHISVVAGLLQGNFTYTEVGLLDKTHIHLFTFNEIVRMFETGSYEIEKLETVVLPISPEQNKLIDNLLNVEKRAQRFMYETFQYVLRARKVD